MMKNNMKIYEKKIQQEKLNRNCFVCILFKGFSKNFVVALAKNKTKTCEFSKSQCENKLFVQSSSFQTTRISHEIIMQ